MTLIGGNELAKVLHYYSIEYDDSCKIVCPFHDDVVPSMKIDFSTGSYYCFGCRVSGDALRFVKDIEKIDDDLEACRKFFKIIHSKKTKHITAIHTERKPTQDKQALAVAHDYYYCLKTVDWLKEKSDVSEYMQARGFTPSALSKCGAKLTYNSSYPIIFPMLDNGEFKGWVCRTNNRTIERKRKYLYNTGFSRETTLCGHYSAPTTIVVEGYMDMLKFRQAGIKNVVALLGWKATGSQINKLKKAGVKNIISALDTDKYGVEGTNYLKDFFNVTRFKFPSGVKDPGDLSKTMILKAVIKTTYDMEVESRLWD